MVSWLAVSVPQRHSAEVTPLARESAMCWSWMICIASMRERERERERERDKLLIAMNMKIVPASSMYKQILERLRRQNKKKINLNKANSTSQRVCHVLVVDDLYC